MWEYQLIEIAPNRPPPEIQDTLNALGEQRWEFVSVYVSNVGYNVFILKRPKAAEERGGQVGFKIDLER